MAYATIGDVGAKLQHITLSETSNPSSSEVTDMLTEIEALMDARFNAVGIDTPVTDSDKLNVVKPILINGAIAQVLRSIDMESEAAAVHQKLFDDAMKHIEKNPAILDTWQSYSIPGGSERGKPHFSRGGAEW